MPKHRCATGLAISPLPCRPSKGLRPLGVLALAWLALLPASRASAAEPLSSWLDGLGEAAASLAEGDAAASLTAARAAQAALPNGRTGARAAAAVGLAHLQGGAPGLAVAPLQAAAEGAGAGARQGLLQIN